MASHPASKEARLRFEKTRTKQLNIRLNDRTDADIIDFFSKIENKRAYLLNLIREDMKKQKMS